MGLLRLSDKGFQLKGASRGMSHGGRRRGHDQHLAFEWDDVEMFWKAFPAGPTQPRQMVFLSGSQYSSHSF